MCSLKNYWKYWHIENRDVLWLLHWPLYPAGDFMSDESVCRKKVTPSSLLISLDRFSSIFSAASALFLFFLGIFNNVAPHTIWKNPVISYWLLDSSFLSPINTTRSKCTPDPRVSSVSPGPEKVAKSCLSRLPKSFAKQQKQHTAAQIWIFIWIQIFCKMLLLQRADKILTFTLKTGRFILSRFLA